MRYALIAARCIARIDIIGRRDQKTMIEVLVKQLPLSSRDFCWPFADYPRTTYGCLAR